MKVEYFVHGFALLIIIIITVKLICFNPIEIPQPIEKFDNSETKSLNIRYRNEYFDLSQFNYSGVCGEIFKYEPNNKRDLILFCSSFQRKSRWPLIKKTSHQIMSMLQTVIPNARKVFLLLGNEPSPTFGQELNNYGIEVVGLNHELPNATGVVQRIFAEKLFLEENKKDIDRVIIADFRDVVFFSDAFATFSKNDLILLMECLSFNSTERCVTLREKTNKRWMKEAYGDEIAEQFAQKEYTLMNGGLFFGGVNKMIELLKIQMENLNKEKMMLWGQDQATLNYIHLTGKLNHLNFTKDYCTQRACFAETYSGYYDELNKRVITKTTGCSPVVRHALYIAKPYFRYPETI